jgi:putative flippase GtrA
MSRHPFQPRLTAAQPGISLSRRHEAAYRARMSLHRQFSMFVVVGVAAAVVHYGVLIALVEMWRIRPVPATLAGYVAGGVVSYALNRRHTYQSDRPHDEAGWRFAVVAGVGFLLTSAFMYLLHDLAGLHYLLAQVVTTGVVLVWSFVAHRLWTFGEAGKAS